MSTSPGDSPTEAASGTLVERARALKERLAEHNEQIKQFKERDVEINKELDERERFQQALMDRQRWFLRKYSLMRRGVGAFVLTMVALATGTVKGFVAAVSWLGSVAAESAIVGVVASLVLYILAHAMFRLRKAHRILYANIELASGVAAIGYVLEHWKDPKAGALAVASGMYVIVRGLDNQEIGLASVAKESDELNKDIVNLGAKIKADRAAVNDLLAEEKRLKDQVKVLSAERRAVLDEIESQRAKQEAEQALAEEEAGAEVTDAQRHAG